MLIDILKSIVYGIIEGITEWLPVSSTGHLILLEKLLPFKNISNYESFFEMYEVVIQLGAIAAVLVLFWHKLWPFATKKERAINPALFKTDTLNLWFKVILAVIPSAFVGLLLDDWLDQHLYNALTVSVTLILYGIFFILVEVWNKKRSPKVESFDTLSYPLAILVGAFQILALIPGTSRSGATILGAIILGLARPVAAEFSFFLAIPTMLGASALKLVKYFLDGGRFNTAELAVLLVGMLVSFIVSLAAIKGLMAYVKKKDFSFFGYYRIILGVIVLASLLI